MKPVFARFIMLGAGWALLFTALTVGPGMNVFGTRTVLDAIAVFLFAASMLPWRKAAP